MTERDGRITIRVELPTHLRTLAGMDREVRLEVPGGGPTVAAALDALEAAHPVLRGTIREHGGGPRRAYMRYFACGEDLSHDPPERPLPGPVLRGEEPLQILGAISGG